MSAPLTLRRWQAEALPLALDAIDGGKRGLIAATTGAGKSIFLAELIRRWRLAHPEAWRDEGPVVVTTPSVQLVEQLGATVADALGSHVVGRYYTRAKQDKREVIVCCGASVPSLAAQLDQRGRRVALWIADEAHTTERPQYLRDASIGEDGEDQVTAEDVERLRPLRRLGLTATPFRSSPDERLRLFDPPMVYRYSPADALRDGVIVPWRFVQWGDDGGESIEVDEACARMIEALGDRATRGPGVVNAKTIEDAVGYVRFLASRGIEARPIHSNMARDEREANVRALREGQIDCLVHVSMLVEGVDYPWLRWGCLRRRVQARVRFIQELGRYLRSAPGKTEAVILDPHDLEGVFHVTYDAALGWQPDEEEAEPDPDEEEAEEEEKVKKDPGKLLTVRRGALDRYVRQMLAALVAEGVCPEPERLAASSWRKDGVSEKQKTALVKMVRMSARLGAKHREAMGKLVETDGLLTKGMASDLFDVLNGVRRLPGGETWTPATLVHVPPDRCFRVPEDPVVHVAGAMKDGLSAVAIVRGPRVLYAGARESRHGDRWVTLATSAAQVAVERHEAQEIASEHPDVVAWATARGIPARLVQGKENIAAQAAWAAIRKYKDGAA